jgi:hypothetical protein
MNYVQAPNSVTAELRKHCDEVSPGRSPILLDIERRPGAQLKACFQNVANIAETEGGNAEYGWAIYAWPRVWHEFRFHAVWRDRTGLLRDPTPSDDGEAVVLFLPSNLSYTGQTRQTRLFPLSDSFHVKRLIAIQTKLFEIQIAYSAEEYTGQAFPPEAVAEMANLQQQFRATEIAMRYQVQRNDLCPCMSRKKYKKCCGRSQQ